MIGDHGVGTNGTVAQRALPAIRTDLVVLPKRGRGASQAWIVQDPTHHTVFEFGPEEYFLFSRLDGRSPAEQVRTQYQEHFRQLLTESELETFVRQLGDQQLLQDWEGRAVSFTEVFARDDILPVSQHRLAGARSDRAIAWLERRLRWAFTRPANYLYLGILALAGMITVASFWDVLEALTAQPTGAFMIVLVAMSALINSARGIVHGVAHKHFGGQIPMMQLSLLAYFVPWVSCDYSGVRWMAKKSDRMWTIFSGIYFELLMWAVGLIAWRITLPGLPNSLWLGLTIGAGGAVVMFTANPLVKLAGYWLLVMWLEIPRLRERSLAVLGAWLTRRPAPEALTPRERKWFILYGALTMLYFVGYWGLVIVFNWSALTGAFGGAGAIAALLLVAFLFHRPLLPVWGRVRPGGWSVVRNSKHRRQVVRVGILLVMIVVLLLPYPYETGGPFTILAQTRTEVNVEVDGGRVIRVFVKDGDFVKPGQVIGQLDPREYERNVLSTAASLEQAQSKLLLLRKEQTLLTNPPDIEAIRALEADVRRLQTMLADFKSQVELTKLKAPLTGRVTTPLIDQAVGKYLKKGDLFAAVEAPQAVQVEIQVPEADAPQVKQGARVKVVAWAYPYETFYGTVRDIAPIALQPAAGEKAAAAKFVRVVAELPNPDLRLKAQLTGYAKIKADVIPVWQVISRLIGRWFAVQFWYWLP
jgi:putative peptide zinc metalloprotease protein